MQQTFLSILDDRQKKDLLDRCELKTFDADEYLFSIGDDGEGFYIVKSGKVAVTGDAYNGKSLVLYYIEAGDSVGELATIDSLPRSASAIAVRNSEIYYISSSEFLRVLTLHPNLSVKLISLLSSRVRRTTQLLWDISFLEAKQRVARRLMEALELNKANDNSLVSSVDLTQLELSYLCGISREHVNKILAQFQSSGLVELQRGKVMVQNEILLQKLSQIEDKGEYDVFIAS